MWYVETARPLRGGPPENLRERVDGIRRTTPTTSEDGDGDANTRYWWRAGLREKRKERCRKPEKDKKRQKACGPDQTPVSDLTAGVEAYRYQGGQSSECSGRGLCSFPKWNIKLGVTTEDRLTTEAR